MKLIHQGEFHRAAIKFNQLLDYDKTDAKAWNGLGMCQVRLHDYHGAGISFLNAIRFDPDNQSYQKNLHELAKKYLKDPPGETEPPVTVKDERKRPDVLGFIGEYPCLCIGSMLLVIYVILLLVGMGATSPKIHIIGLSGFIFILFFLDKSFMTYLAHLGVKTMHIFAIFVIVAGMAGLIVLLITLPGPGPAPVYASDQWYPPSPLITPHMSTNHVQTPHDLQDRLPDTSGEAMQHGHTGIPCTKPRASFEYKVISTDPYQVRFSIPGDGAPTGPDEVVWDFGDQTNTTEREPVHEYQGSPETYEVTLTIRNACGETDSVTRTIEPV